MKNSKKTTAKATEKFEKESVDDLELNESQLDIVAGGTVVLNDKSHEQLCEETRQRIIALGPVTKFIE